METFSALLALCAGNSPVPGEFLHKGQWRGALMFSLICARKNGWVNNREAGDLRRHSAHCDVIVMFLGKITVAEVNGKTAHVWCLHTHVCISSWHAYWSLQNAYIIKTTYVCTYWNPSSGSARKWYLFERHVWFSNGEYCIFLDIYLVHISNILKLF